MNLAFVCSEYPPGEHGGIGTFTQTAGRALARAGHTVRVIGVYPRGCPAPDYEEDQGVRVWRLRDSGHRGAWLLSRRRLYRAVARWSRSGEIDLIELPDWQGWAAAWPALPVPVVVRLHGSAVYLAAELERPLSPVSAWLERASLRRADAWCSNSRYTAVKTQRLYRLRTQPVMVRYNPVAVLASPVFAERSRHTVIFAGTLNVNKGVVSLARAWPRVKAACPAAALEMFGRDGGTGSGQPMPDYLLSLLDPALRSSVRFHGHVARARLTTELGRARVAVFPSYAESFANTPVEAMACACPTIYTCRCSGPELIQHEHNGLLVDPDDPDMIADAIVRVLTDDELAMRLGDAGRERIRACFSFDRVIEQNEAFFARCVSEHARAHRGASA